MENRLVACELSVHDIKINKKTTWEVNLNEQSEIKNDISSGKKGSVI